MRHSSPPPVPGTLRRVHVSAAVFLDQFQLAKEVLGPEAVDRAIATLPAAARTEIEELLPVSWLCIDTAAQFHYAVAKQANKDPIEWHRLLTRLGLERTFTTVWRLFMRLVSVEALIKRTAVIYARSYDTGRIEAQLIAPGHIEATLSDWPDIPEFEIDALTSGVQAMLHIAGRRTASVTWRRHATGIYFDVRYT